MVAQQIDASAAKRKPVAKKSVKPGAAKPKRKPGRPAHSPSDEQRQEVQRMRLAGYEHDRIAAVLGISVDTLRKFYRDELDNSSARLLSNVAATLYTKAIAGDTTACIFICKTRLGWRETERKELTGADGAPLPGMQFAALPPMPLIEFVDGDPADEEAPEPDWAVKGSNGS